MIRRLNRFRWRLASLIAPSPIVAAPTGDEQAYLFIRAAENASAWIATRTLDIEMSNHLDIAPITDRYALGTMAGPRGTFSGTIGHS
jgi:hypothetical protein